MVITVKEVSGMRGATLRRARINCLTLALLLLIAAILPWQADAGTAGKVYNLSLDIGSLDNQPIYYITSFPTTIKVRAKVIDQTGAPIAGLTSTQLVIFTAKNATTNVVWTPGTEYVVGSFTEVGDGLYDRTVTLNPGALATNNIGRFEVRLTGAPAVDNQWLASSVFIKNGSSAADDVKYAEVQPQSGCEYSIGDYAVIPRDVGCFRFNVLFYGPAGDKKNIGQTSIDTYPGPVVLGVANWAQSTGSVAPSTYRISGFRDHSGSTYQYFLTIDTMFDGGSFWFLPSGDREYITVSATNGAYEFLIPLGYTALTTNATNLVALPVPTYVYPALFPVTDFRNYYAGVNKSTSPPGTSAVTANMIMLSTNIGTDTVQGVRLDLGAGGAQAVSRIDITESTGTTVYGTLQNPASDTPLIPFTQSLAVTTGLGFAHVKITPKTHNDMPSPPGASHLISAKATEIVHTANNFVTSADWGSPVLTIDNLSPANPAWSTIIPGNNQVNLSWANPADADYGQAVILRNTVPIEDTPTEGAGYAAGASIGASRVVCVVNKPGTNCIDSGLTNGTGYYYRIFAKDTNGNYSAGGTGSGPHVLGQQTTSGTCAAAAAGPTSLEVTMPYTNDINGNSRYTVDFKLSSTGNWTNWVTAAAHTASPYVTTITGLSQSNGYDVRCTFLDADAVEGVATQTIPGIILPDYRTTVGVAAAVAVHGTAMSVTMPYGDDRNGNNRYTVEYKQSSDTNWTSWVTGTLHTASPYASTITGLTQATSYDIRVTYLDSDGVNGTNPQIINGILLPDNQTWANWATAVAIGATTIEVNAPFFHDANGNGTLMVEYMNPYAPGDSWKIAVNDAPYPIPDPNTPYERFCTVKIKELKPLTAYIIRVTYKDPDGVVWGPAEQNIGPITTLASRLMHNSQNANKKGYWAEYGGWGLTGTQYGEFTCLTCHSKRTTNASGIRTYINLYPLGGSDNFGGPVRFNGTGGTYGFGDDSVPRPSAPAINRICEVCHTLTRGGPSQTPEHRKIQPVPADHNPPDCIRCHTHETGFKSPF